MRQRSETVQVIPASTCRQEQKLLTKENDLSQMLGAGLVSESANLYHYRYNAQGLTLLGVPSGLESSFYLYIVMHLCYDNNVDWLCKRAQSQTKKSYWQKGEPL